MSEMVSMTLKNKVATVTLNRPEALNALCAQLLKELKQILAELEANDDVHVIVITGSEKAFAAGADIKEMVDKSYSDIVTQPFLNDDVYALSHSQKVTIAAVSGYALGGGCELAMMCDFIIAAENAQFGQPEVTIGTMPGFGGTQRLTRLVGRAKAMKMCLTGARIKADEALSIGLVAEVVSADSLLEHAQNVAETIASYSLPVTKMIKEAINRADETSLSEGLLFEKRQFHASFALEDRREGMQAFVEKRKADFKNK